MNFNIYTYRSFVDFTCWTRIKMQTQYIKSKLFLLFSVASNHFKIVFFQENPAEKSMF